MTNSVIQRIMTSKTIKHVAFSLIPAIVLFTSIEIVLRLVNFQYANMPLEMRSAVAAESGVVEGVLKYNNKDGARFKKDSKQLWVPVASPLEDYEKQKTPLSIRVATLGDSCTQECYATDATYPGLMEVMLSAATGRKADVLNAGVGSYSSYQGLQRFKHVVLKYRPDIVTIFFGWNDHWISFRQDKDVRLPNEAVVFVANIFERFRIYQALNYLVTKRRVKAAGKPAPTYRVPPQEYAKNLNDIISVAREAGVTPVLITAPSDLSNFEPRAHFPFPKERLIPVHAQYNNIVRAVAKRRDIPLIDLAALVDAHEGETIFSKDGVHFNPSGCKFVATAISKYLLAVVLKQV